MGLLGFSARLPRCPPVSAAVSGAVHVEAGVSALIMQPLRAHARGLPRRTLAYASVLSSSLTNIESSNQAMPSKQ